jgi:hypothetical protein
MMKCWTACCYDCGEGIEVEARTQAMAMKEIRRVDWSFGRDKRWRCSGCRPRRFGESL